MKDNPHLADLVKDDDAMVGFWVIESERINGLDSELVNALVRWFDNAWKFGNVFFNVFRDHDQQIETLVHSGLEEYTEVLRPGRGQFKLFARP